MFLRYCFGFEMYAIFPYFLKIYSVLKLGMYTTLKWIVDKDICKWVSWSNGFPVEGGILPTRGRQLVSMSFYMIFFFFVQAE